MKSRLPTEPSTLRPTYDAYPRRRGWASASAVTSPGSATRVMPSPPRVVSTSSTGDGSSLAVPGGRPTAYGEHPAAREQHEDHHTGPDQERRARRRGRRVARGRLHGPGQGVARGDGGGVAGARLGGRLHVDVVVDAVLLDPDATRVGLRHEAGEPVAAHGLADRGVRRDQVGRVAVEDLLHLLDLGLTRGLNGRDVLLLVELVVGLVAVERVRRPLPLAARHVAQHRVGV